MFFDTPRPEVMRCCVLNQDRAVRREYCAAGEEGSIAECWGSAHSAWVIAGKQGQGERECRSSAV